ncbi:MAG: FAD-binding protein, partial [Pedobacter sp.]
MPVIQENKSLKTYNTFGIEAFSKAFTEIFDEAELKELLQQNTLPSPLFILGGGSNVLFTNDFEGIIVKISIPGISSNVNGDAIEVTAGAGVVWHDLVTFCVQ